DSAELPTNYHYYLIGRLKDIMPPGAAVSEYAYTDATIAGSTFTNAKVSASTVDTASNAIKTDYIYDPFGRITRENRLMPDNTWSTQETIYDVLGRKASISER